MPPLAALDVLRHHLVEMISMKMLSDDDNKQRERVVEKLNTFIDAEVESKEIRSSKPWKPC